MHYKWVIAWISFITLLLAYGTRYCFSVFYVPVATEFGWSRALTATAYSIHVFVYGIGAVCAGFFVDRFSPKKLITFGTVLLSLSLAVCSQFQTLCTFI